MSFLDSEMAPMRWAQLEQALGHWRVIAAKEASANTGAELDGDSQLIDVEMKPLSEGVDPAQAAKTCKVTTWK